MLLRNKKKELINLVDKYKDWLYNKTNLYNDLIIETEDGLKVNEDFIKRLGEERTEKWIQIIKKDIEWHS